jgi:hypothetical protein
MKTKCIGCSSTKILFLIDFGLQWPSNNYVLTKDDVSEPSSLAIAQCLECGLIQLIDPMAPEVTKSKYSWLNYSEPESHLDEMVSFLSELPCTSTSMRIIGLTYKDDTTLQRFQYKGFLNTYRYDSKQDIGLYDELCGIESIQSKITAEIGANLANYHGKADLLIARHLLEHVHSPEHFLSGVANLLSHEGRVVFEVPDCTKLLINLNYSLIWEEHTMYFVSNTLVVLLQRHGFIVEALKTFTYSLEDSLVVVARRSLHGKSSVGAADKHHLITGSRFASLWATTRQDVHKAISRMVSRGQRVVIFGAGHIAAKFINFFDLRNFIQAVVDDNPHKVGLKMPGGTVPIIDSGNLADYDVCLTTLSNEKLHLIRTKLDDFQDMGGYIFSIFDLMQHGQNYP